MTIVLTLAAMFTLLLMRVPVAFALGGLGLAMLLLGGFSPLMAPQAVLSTLDGFILLAVPLFLLMSNILLRAGVGNMERSRGAALVDLDLDGRLDIVVVNRSANAEILHNRTDDSGGWLQIALRQDGGNRDAIGAWIEVRAGDELWRKEVVIGGGHASGQAGWHHFGLGGEDDAEFRVQWPDGSWSGWQAAGSNRFVTVKREGYAVSLAFGPKSAL